MLDSHRLALAHAVAASPTARPLTADNTAGPAVRLPDAVGSGRSFFVTPRPDLLVVDVDPADQPERSVEVTTAADLLLEAADRAGVPVLTVDSGRPGHRHVYLVTGTGTLREQLARWCTQRGLDVRTRGVRPPGTPHRVLPVNAWSDYLAVEHALAVLSAAPDRDATGRLVADLCPVTLPRRVMTAVKLGHEAAGYTSPSHARMALALAVRSRGGSVNLLRAILEDPTSPVGATYRARPHRWQDTELARLWEKAGVFIAGRGAVDQTGHVRQVAAAAAAAPWPGTGGGSDLAVLEELLRVAARVGTRTPAVSLGDLALGAGVSVDTARAAVRRLTARGWIQVVAPATANTARMYALTCPAAQAHDAPPTHRPVAPARDEVGDLGHDAARWAALGKVTTRVLRTLDDVPMPVRVLASKLAMAPASVRHHLRKLARHGLAEKTGHGWYRTRPVDLQAVASSCGVAGARDAQARHLAAYRQARAAYRTR